MMVVDAVPVVSLQSVVKKRLTFVEGRLSDLSSGLSAVDGEEFNILFAEVRGLREFLGMLGAERDLLDYDGDDFKVRLALEGRVNAFKVWWSRFNQTLIQGWSRVVDREARLSGVDEGVKRLSVQQLNVFLADAGRELKRLEAKK